MGMCAHGFHKLVHVPSVLRADRHRVGDAVQEVQLLNADCVDLVQNVDDRDVTSALGFEDVDAVVNGSITPAGNVRRVDSRREQ